MPAFLMIENPGVCPPEGFTVLGVSLADTSDNSGVIGQFGSGNKHGVTLCLRKGLEPTIYCGTLRLEFFTKPQTVSDSKASKDFARVCVRYGGTYEGVNKTSTEDLGFVLDYGKKDWDDIALALREFISNSIDRCIRENGNWDDVRIEIVEDARVRAKAGVTRVFLPLTAEVLDFYNNLGKWFLHFSEPESINSAILPKKDRNLGDRQAAVIYRRGVRVREFQSSELKSLFDYNLNDLSIDEARKASDWDVRYHCGQALANANADVLTVLFNQMMKGDVGAWEFTFDNSALSYYYGNERRSAKWKTAFHAAAGDKAVLAGDEATAERLTRKGYEPIIACEAILSAASHYGVPTATTVLTLDEMAGRIVTEPTDTAKTAVEYVWAIVKNHGLSRGKDLPPVLCFSTTLDGGAMLNGYYAEGMVYINSALAPAGQATMPSNMLLKVALEEVAHYVTEATDNSRDFQDYLLELATKLICNPLTHAAEEKMYAESAQACMANERVI